MDPGKDREHLLALKGVVFCLPCRFACYWICVLLYCLL